MTVEIQVGRTRLIRANDESPLVGPMREILAIATGPVVMLAEELGGLDGIESAFLYGSFAARMLGDAGPAAHDIDVMVLGEPDVDAVYEACTRVEAAVHRRVNPRYGIANDACHDIGEALRIRSSFRFNV